MAKLFLITSCIAFLIGRSFTFSNNNDKSKFTSLERCLISKNVISIIPRNKTSKEYTTLNYQWNTYKGTIYPLAYIIPRSVKDIQTTVKCCQKYGLRLVSKSGGHSYVKFGFGNSHSVVLDLKELNDVQVSNNVVTVGPGNTLGMVQYKLLGAGPGKENLLIPAGMCPSVGIAGHALGGGYGAFARLYGLLTDNLVELDMVDAKGRLLAGINKNTYPDLYWAHRGGGGGNFGIVTRLQFKTYIAPKFMIYGEISYRIEQFPKFFSEWQSMLTIDNTILLFVDINLDIQDTFILSVYKTILPNENTISAMEQVNNILEQFPEPPNSNSSTISIQTYETYLTKVGPRNYGKKVNQGKLQNPADLTKLKKYPKEYIKVKSFYMDKILKWNEILELYILIKKTIRNANVSMYLEPYGNGNTAINSMEPNETAFVHRKKNILYDFVIDCREDPGGNSILSPSLILVEEFYKEMLILFNHKESYQNYLDENLVDYLTRYYGENLLPLVRIKKSVDPGNFFNHPLSIPIKL